MSEASTLARPEPLDSPAACVRELSEINREVAKFGHLWAAAAGELKRNLMAYERLHRSALRGLTNTDLKVAEKDAAAHAAVEETNPGLADTIEQLEGEIEQHKVLFRALERRSSNAQSILAALRAESKMSEHIAPEPAWRPPSDPEANGDW